MTQTPHRTDFAMVHADAQIKHLVEAFAAAHGIAASYSSRILTGSGGTLNRISGGMSLTSRRAAKIVQGASNNWPADLAWPSDIPRPDPTPGSPAAIAAEDAA